MGGRGHVDGGEGISGRGREGGQRGVGLAEGWIGRMKRRMSKNLMKELIVFQILKKKLRGRIPGG